MYGLFFYITTKTIMRSFKYLIIIAVFCIGFLFNPKESRSQVAFLFTDAQHLVKNGLDKIYNVEFDSAKVYVDELKEKFPTHPAGYFMDAMMSWWKLTLYRNLTRFDEEFLDKIDKTIEVSNAVLDTQATNLTGLFFKAGAIGYRAHYNSKRQNWIDAATDGNAALELLNQCHVLAPGNHDIMLGTGVYNYFADVFPKKYPLLKPLMWFYPRGDKDIGLLQLISAAKYANYANIEAKVTLMQIYNLFEKDVNNAYLMAKDLHTMYPMNAYFHRYYARLLVRLSEHKDYENEWRTILKRRIDKVLGYDNQTAREALYYIGKALFRKNDLESALKYFRKCDEASDALDDEVTGFKVETNIMIARIYERMRNYKAARNQYKHILDNIDDLQGAHERAEKALDRIKNIK